MRERGTAKLEGLRRHPAFRVLTDALLRELGARAVTHHYPAGKVVLREQEAADRVYLFSSALASCHAGICVCCS